MEAISVNNYEHKSTALSSMSTHDIYSMIARDRIKSEIRNNELRLTLDGTDLNDELINTLEEHHLFEFLLSSSLAKLIEEVGYTEKSLKVSFHRSQLTNVSLIEQIVKFAKKRRFNIQLDLLGRNNAISSKSKNLADQSINMLSQSDLLCINAL